jgi:hypothetical protein
MNRHRLIVLALVGGLLTAAIPSLAHAQIGDALVYAEQTCLGHGIAPNSAAFNACVEREARAYDRGRPGFAEREAGSAREARSDCLHYGIDPHTLGYRYCNSKIDRRSDFPPASRPRSSRLPPYSAIVHPNAR